jgi:hypothetical protein
LEELWPKDTPQDEKELEVIATFPLTYPAGIFERMSSRIHDYVNTRFDWSNVIYAELLNNCKMFLRRGLNSDNYDCEVSMVIRGQHLDDVQQNMAVLIPELKNVIASAQGLTWYMYLRANNCGPGDLKYFFPPQVLQVD